MTGTYSIQQDLPTPAPRQAPSQLAHAVSDDGTLGLIMELSGKLQTTLELETLIELFAQVMHSQFHYDSLNYCSSDTESDISYGKRRARNRLDYDLKVLDSDLGVISITRGRRFSESEISQIENLFAALLYPLRNALLYQTAIQSAFLDSLTGVKNRTAFDANFSREIEFNRRKQTDLSLIVMDIDFFKRINDQYGHAVGDQVLEAVANTVEQTIRSSDALYRYGGEEFVVVLNGTDMDGAKLLAERIRENIEKLRIKSLKDIAITLSLGVTVLREDDTAQTLFERADAALYSAKTNGRNQVVSDE